MTTPATPTEVEEHRSAQAQEYGTYVAAEKIDIGGARAFNPGDAVPASHVTRGVVREDQVRRVEAAQTVEPVAESATAKKKG